MKALTEQLWHGSERHALELRLLGEVLWDRSDKAIADILRCNRIGHECRTTGQAKSGIDRPIIKRIERLSVLSSTPAIAIAILLPRRPSITPGETPSRSSNIWTAAIFDFAPRIISSPVRSPGLSARLTS